jgi:hypothetical protein
LAISKYGSLIKEGLGDRKSLVGVAAERISPRNFPGETKEEERREAFQHCQIPWKKERKSEKGRLFGLYMISR